MSTVSMQFDLFFGSPRDLRDPEKTRVVVLHGLDYRGKDMGVLADSLTPFYDCVVVADYDWRHAFDRLSARLDEFLERNTRGIGTDLLAHSYGGLIARHYLEARRPGRSSRVRHLILLNTPNHGSALFHLMRASPIIEYSSRYLSRGLKSVRLLALDDRDQSIRTLTEVGRAKSALDKLNHKPRNASVTYWVLATERDWWRVGGNNWKLPATGRARLFHLFLSPPESNSLLKLGNSILTPESFGHSDVLRRPWATGFMPIVKRIVSSDGQVPFAVAIGDSVIHFDRECRANRKGRSKELTSISPGSATYRVCPKCATLEARRC